MLFLKIYNSLIAILWDFEFISDFHDDWNHLVSSYATSLRTNIVEISLQQFIANFLTVEEEQILITEKMEFVIFIYSFLGCKQHKDLYTINPQLYELWERAFCSQKIIETLHATCYCDSNHILFFRNFTLHFLKAPDLVTLGYYHPHYRQLNHQIKYLSLNCPQIC